MTSRVVDLLPEYSRSRRGPVAVGDLLHKPGASFGPRTQTDFQLIVVRQGSLRIELDRKVVEVPKEHGILLCPGRREHFFFATDCDTRHSWMAVAPSAITPALCRELSYPPAPAPFFGRMSTMFEMLRQPARHRDSASLLHGGLTLGLALALLCEFCSAASGRIKPPTAANAVLDRLDSLLVKAYAEPLSLRDLATGAGVSQQHLLKICRAAGRLTPMQQLSRKRLEAAADLLLNTGLPLSQISQQCGFLNPFHFSRNYKQLWGESPLRWRQRQWKPGKVQRSEPRRRAHAGRDTVLRGEE